jgi:putative ATPase
VPQDYLPPEVKMRTFYEAGPFGFEKDIGKRLAWWQSMRERAAGGAGSSQGEPDHER